MKSSAQYRARSLLLALGGISSFPNAAPGQTTIVDFQKVVTTSDTIIEEENGPQKIVVCSAGPFTVKAQDLVTAHVQLEVTWPGGGKGRIMVGGGIVVATSPTAVDDHSEGYVGMLSKFATNNLDRAKETYEVLTRTGSFQFSANYGAVYINCIAYGHTLPKCSPGPDAVIPAGYAELVAVVERGVMRFSDTTYPHLPYDKKKKNHYVPVGNNLLYTQYACGPLNIPANSMVDVRFQVEGSTPVKGEGPITPRLGRRLIQATSKSSTEGTSLNPDLQGGATNMEHHATFSTVGGIYVPLSANNVFFNSVLWARGTGSKFYIETETATLYGGFAVEVRPFVGFWEDEARDIVNVDGTKRVLYSVGPIDVPAAQVVEVRYQAAFSPDTNVGFDSMIVRGTSATATTGTEIQRPLYRRYDPSYTYTNALHSTAERPTIAANGQYYNVVVWLPHGGTLPVKDWGQLEVVFR